MVTMGVHIERPSSPGFWKLGKMVWRHVGSKLPLKMRLSNTSLSSSSSLPWAIFPLLDFTSHVNALSSLSLSSRAPIGPAVAKVPAISSVGTPYFEYETRQLTDEVIRSIREDSSTAEYAGLFDFDNGVDADALGPATHGKCKVFPGDEDWPSEEKWDKFDELLGNALIPTIPLAAPCYPSWGEYSTDKCEEITAKWSDAYFQYGCLLVPLSSVHMCLSYIT